MVHRTYQAADHGQQLFVPSIDVQLLETNIFQQNLEKFVT